MNIYTWSVVAVFACIFIFYFHARAKFYKEHDESVEKVLAKTDGDKLYSLRHQVRPGTKVAKKWAEKSLRFLENLVKYDHTHTYWCQALAPIIAESNDEDLKKRAREFFLKLNRELTDVET